jgi:hypothetical protein
MRKALLEPFSQNRERTFCDYNHPLDTIVTTSSLNWFQADLEAGTAGPNTLRPRACCVAKLRGSPGQLFQQRTPT